MLTKEQAGRVLEDIQRLALVHNTNKALIEAFASANNLLREEMDAIGRDITGMLNGNTKNKKETGGK